MENGKLDSMQSFTTECLQEDDAHPILAPWMQEPPS